MTNTQEAFENTLHNICDNLRDDGIDADIGEYVNRIMQSRQAHNDAVIAAKDMVIDSCESKIAARDEALQGANAVIAELVEALEVMTPIYNQLAWVAVCWNDHNFDANSIYTKINTAFNEAGFKRGEGVEPVNNFVEKLDNVIAKHKKDTP